MNKATIRVFEPNQLARDEKDRLLGALEGFVNVGDGLEDFLAFGRQNPEFFPIQVLDGATRSDNPLPPPSVQGTSFRVEGEKRIWHKVLSWSPACHNLAVFYRDILRRACWPTVPQHNDVFTGDTFLILLGIDPPAGIGDWVDAFQAIRDSYPLAKADAPQFSRLQADWKTGTFEYAPDNDFQRAVYILFREGWRAKTCVQCSRRFIANKPVQSYCSTNCAGEAKRERNLAWWNRDGKKWRKKRELKTRSRRDKPKKKGGR